MLKRQGLTKKLSVKAVTQLFFIRVEKHGEGWRAVVVVNDQQDLANRLLTVKRLCEANGMPVPPSEVAQIRTGWLYDQSVKGVPQFTVAARASINAKCVAMAMLMYGSKPSDSYTWDCLRQADVGLLDRVTGICGENTMVMCKEVTGLKIPFSLPMAGRIPLFMSTVLAKYCRNDDRGYCLTCLKTSRPGVVFGKTYSCGHFVHDACAIDAHFRYMCREKVWNFRCECGSAEVFTSPSKMFNPLRLTIMTGDNVSALEANMDKYRKNGDDTLGNVPGVLLAKSIRSMLKNVGLERHSIRVNDLVDECLFFLDMPDKTKAGAWFQDGMSSFWQNDDDVRNRQNPTKTEVVVLAGVQCIAYIESLKEEFREFIYEGGKLDSRKLQAFAWERCLVFKVNTKVEALVVQDDADKMRMFFPSHVCKFIFDNVIWKNLVQRLYLKGAVMLGFRWLDGGAEKLFRKYARFKKIMAWDISGLDSSMKAKLIQQIFEALFHAFNPKSVDESTFRLFKLLYIICVGHYVSKIVAWVDHFRIMVGSMASGELMTSIFNTIYCIVAIFSWLHHIADLIFGEDDQAKGKKEWVKKNIEEAILLIFGDDGLLGTDEPQLSLIEDVEFEGKTFPSLDTFLKKHWKMSIKRADSIQTTKLLSTPDEFGDLPANSVTILKRGFVKTCHNGKMTIGPYKSTSITIGKLLKHEAPPDKAGSKSYCSYLMMCRAVGHAVDTAGMNKFMYDVCKYTYDTAYSVYTLAVGVDEMNITQEEMNQLEVENIGEVLMRVAGDNKMERDHVAVVKFPEWEELRAMFLEPREYDKIVDDVAVRRQKLYNRKLYSASLDK